MRRKFRSETAARKFAKHAKIKRGPACKMSDGTKGRWYTITYPKKRKR